MENGVVLVDRRTGLKLLVVEQPFPDLPEHSIRVEGRPVEREDALLVEAPASTLVLTADPGSRG